MTGFFADAKKFMDAINLKIFGSTKNTTVAEIVYANYTSVNKILNHSILLNTEYGYISKSIVFDLSHKIPNNIAKLDESFEVSKALLLDTICCVCYCVNNKLYLKCRHNLCHDCYTAICLSKISKSCPLCLKTFESGITQKSGNALPRVYKSSLMDAYLDFLRDDNMIIRDAVLIFSLVHRKPLAIFWACQQEEFVSRETNGCCKNFWKVNMEKKCLFSLIAKKVFGFVTAEQTNDQKSLCNFNICLMLPDRCILQSNKKEMKANDILLAEDFFRDLIVYLCEFKRLVIEEFFVQNSMQDDDLIVSCMKELETRKTVQDLHFLKIKSKLLCARHHKIKTLKHYFKEKHALRRHQKYKNIIKYKKSKLMLKKMHKNYIKSKLINFYMKQKHVSYLAMINKRSSHNTTDKQKIIETYFQNEKHLKQVEASESSESNTELDLDFGSD